MQVVRRDERVDGVLLGGVGRRDCVHVDRCQILKRATSRAPGLHHGADRRVEAGAVHLQHHNPVAVRIRQWREQKAVDDREDGRVRTDPERQCQYGDRCEGRGSPDLSSGVIEILPRLVEPLAHTRAPGTPSIDAAAVPAKFLDVPELA